SRSIAFGDTGDVDTPSAIYILSLEDGRRRKVTSPPPGYVGDRQPKFSPDGQSIAFVRTSSDDISWICLSDMHGGEPRRVTEDQQGSIRGFAWDPRNRDIVFGRYLPGGITLWRVNASGGSARPIPAAADRDAIQPAITRNGRRLAYTRFALDTNIRRTPLTGNKRAVPMAGKAVVFTTSREGYPEFSPDGESIAYISERSGVTEVWRSGSD